jgi:ATP-dependent Lon protease
MGSKQRTDKDTFNDKKDAAKSGSDKSSSAKGDSVLLPVLPLRDVVLFPHMVMPLFVGRDKSINALEEAMANNQNIFLVAQKTPEEQYRVKNLYNVGTIASVLQLLRLPDGTFKVLVEGQRRAKVKEFVGRGSKSRFLSVLCQPLSEISKDKKQIKASMRSLLSQFELYLSSNPKVPPELMNTLSGIEDPSRLTDTIVSHLDLKVPQRQKVLEQQDILLRIGDLMELVEGELEVLKVEKKIRKTVKSSIEKNQRDYYLTEQMKAIRKELDESEGISEIEALEEAIKKAKMPAEALKKTNSELKKLKAMPLMSAESTVSRNYIDYMIEVPWSKRSKTDKSMRFSKETLEEDHYGLGKVKERIIEYLAVHKRVGKIKGPILCLVGPPGVGKTSLGASIARATGRPLTRVALGGIRDEAEIRGHRRTYIGSMPGKIVQKLSKEGVKNPVFLLDEIDKMAMDFRGDPASALLEVLDPEQNCTFNDHYLEVDLDLSEVFFICTANSMNIPSPLLDRMEVIHLSGYTEDEKLNIAKKYLVKKVCEANGLSSSEFQLADTVLLKIIRGYTRESGVRSLERKLSKIARKVVTELTMEADRTKNKAKVKKSKPFKVKQVDLQKYLGVKKYTFGLADKKSQLGQVTGLAWTEVGGELLKIEATVVPGKGKTIRTGQLGDVMKESISAALTVVRSRAKDYDIDASFHEKKDIHVHVPEGATPKDGPSAGIGMCTALVSALSGKKVRADVAMTGEITLRGEVLPIGGLKEKLLAARRGGIKTVIIPEENKRHLIEIPKEITDPLEVIPVRWIEQVLDLALVSTAKVKNKSKN